MKQTLLFIVATISFAPFLAWSAESTGIQEIFEYQLPVTTHINTQHPDLVEHTKCKVKSFTLDGDRYYQMYLSWPNHVDQLIASAKTSRGKLTHDSFSYQDVGPEFIEGSVVSVKYFTAYRLDPQTAETHVATMYAVDPSGKLLYNYVCSDLDPTS